MTASCKILYEDNHLLVIVKPSGLATQGVRDEPSVVTWAKDYLKRKYNKPGNVYLGVVSRLDKPVSGVLVLARTSKAAGRLSQQFRVSTVEKRYLAMVAVDSHEQASLSDEAWHRCLSWLRKSEAARKMQLVSEQAAGAVRAELRWRIRAKSGAQALLEVELITGRKHQIRAQLAAGGLPILGDWKYGRKTSRRSHRQGTVGRPEGIALHAWSLRFRHPVGGRALVFAAPPPIDWQNFNRELAGRASELEPTET